MTKNYGLFWRDASSYSRSDEERIPTIWELKVADFRISLHRLHGSEGWFLTCRDIGVERFGLGIVEEEEAKKKAIAKSIDFISEKISEYENAKTLLVQVRGRTL